MSCEMLTLLGSSGIQAMLAAGEVSEATKKVALETRFLYQNSGGSSFDVRAKPWRLFLLQSIVRNRF